MVTQGSQVTLADKTAKETVLLFLSFTVYDVILFMDFKTAVKTKVRSQRQLFWANNCLIINCASSPAQKFGLQFINKSSILYQLSIGYTVLTHFYLLVSPIPGYALYAISQSQLVTYQIILLLHHKDSADLMNELNSIFVQKKIVDVYKRQA